MYYVLHVSVYRPCVIETTAVGEKVKVEAKNNQGVQFCKRNTSVCHLLSIGMHV